MHRLVHIQRTVSEKRILCVWEAHAKYIRATFKIQKGKILYVSMSH